MTCRSALNHRADTGGTCERTVSVAGLLETGLPAGAGNVRLRTGRAGPANEHVPAIGMFGITERQYRWRPKGHSSPPCPVSHTAATCGRRDLTRTAIHLTASSVGTLLLTKPQVLVFSQLADFTSRLGMLPPLPNGAATPSRTSLAAQTIPLAIHRDWLAPVTTGICCYRHARADAREDRRRTDTGTTRSPGKGCTSSWNAPNGCSPRQRSPTSSVLTPRP